MAIDRTLLRAVRADLDEALKTIGGKYNLLMKIGSGRFTESSATLKLEIADAEASPDATSPGEAKARAAWPRYSAVLGLSPDWLDKQFVYGGEWYTVLGIANSRPKYPVMTRKVRTDTITYHTSAGVIGAFAAMGSSTGKRLQPRRK